MKKKKKENIIITYLPLIGGILTTLILIVFGFCLYYPDYKADKLCQEEGYDYSTSQDMESGYIKCVKEVYVNHELVKEKQTSKTIKLKD